MPTKHDNSRKPPDDLMFLSVRLQFQAKLNPDVQNPQPVEITEIENTFSAADAAPYLEEVLAAIRGRRLYGHMMQEAAEGPVASGQWIAMTAQDIVTAMRQEEPFAPTSSDTARND
jgi:hypothetical protein